MAEPEPNELARRQLGNLGSSINSLVNGVLSSALAQINSGLASATKLPTITTPKVVLPTVTTPVITTPVIPTPLAARQLGNLGNSINSLINGVLSSALAQINSGLASATKLPSITTPKIVVTTPVITTPVITTPVITTPVITTPVIAL